MNICTLSTEGSAIDHVRREFPWTIIDGNLSQAFLEFVGSYPSGGPSDCKGPPGPAMGTCVSDVVLTVSSLAAAALNKDESRCVMDVKVFGEGGCMNAEEEEQALSA